jgi:hypothetical protein
MDSAMMKQIMPTATMMVEIAVCQMSSMIIVSVTLVVEFSNKDVKINGLLLRNQHTQRKLIHCKQKKWQTIKNWTFPLFRVNFQGQK